MDNEEQIDQSSKAPEPPHDSIRIIRILPPKENFRKLLENPALISDEAREIERELFGDFDSD